MDSVISARREQIRSTTDGAANVKRTEYSPALVKVDSRTREYQERWKERNKEPKESSVVKNLVTGGSGKEEPWRKVYITIGYLNEESQEERGVGHLCICSTGSGTQLNQADVEAPGSTDSETISGSRGIRLATIPPNPTNNSLAVEEGAEVTAYY